MELSGFCSATIDFFPIKCADVRLCLFAHVMFADVRMEQRDQQKGRKIKTEREMINGFKPGITQTMTGKTLLTTHHLYLIWKNCFHDEVGTESSRQFILQVDFKLSKMTQSLLKLSGRER